MKYMECTTCHNVVKINETGTCLACQKGFTNKPQEDAWKPEDETKKKSSFMSIHNVYQTHMDNEIKKLRLSLGLTQFEFANKLFVSLTTVSRWETNSFKPSKLYRKKLEEIAND